MAFDVSSSVPSSSCTNTALFNRKRKLNESEVNKQQKDEKLKSDTTAKAETSKQDICHNLYHIFKLFFVLSLYLPKILLNSGDAPFLRLCLRLPNGSKETISMCAKDTVEVCA